MSAPSAGRHIATPYPLVKWEDNFRPCAGRCAANSALDPPPVPSGVLPLPALSLRARIKSIPRPVRCTATSCPLVEGKDTVCPHAGRHTSTPLPRCAFRDDRCTTTPRPLIEGKDNVRPPRWKAC